MVDIISFTLSLPSLLQRSYFISPGVVSVIFRVIWSIFTFLVVTFLIQYGFAAAGIKKSETERRFPKSLWHLHQDYSRVQNVSNGRWGGMILNLASTRVILGILFWAVIYIFELLFSLSIDNAYISHYNGTACVGRVDNFTALSSTMFSSIQSVGGLRPPQNITLLRQLLNENQVGNIALLGDGIFAISPPDAIYKKNQTISVARAGFNCNYTVNLGEYFTYGIYYTPPKSPNITIPHFPNLNDLYIPPLTPEYANLIVANFIDMTLPNVRNVYFGSAIGNSTLFLILVSNPVNYFNRDINNDLYNSSVILQECLMHYEYGTVTIAEDGYLNETNIGTSYLKVDNDTVTTDFSNSGIDYDLFWNPNFLTLFDYPNDLLDVHYNQPYPTTMKIANKILSAYLVNGLSPNADLCTFNHEQVPVYVLVLGTSMSFGYILIGVAFTLASLLILTAFALTVFSQEERSSWLLYSNDWRFTGYVFTGSNMDKKEFKEYAQNTFIKCDDSNDEYQENENDSSRPETLLKNH